MKRFLKIFSICFIFLAIVGLALGYFYQSMQIKSLQQEIENQNQIIDNLNQITPQSTATPSSQISWRDIEEGQVEIGNIRSWMNIKKQREQIMNELGVDSWEEVLAMMEADQK